MGRLHMMNSLHVDGVKVVSVADRSERALEKASDLGIRKLYRDYRKMILGSDLDLEAVIISLPNFLHYDSIVSSLEAGLHVFVEKPMAISVEECEKIVKLVKETGLSLMVWHSLRFYGPIEKMKAAVENGTIGGVEAITLEEIVNGPFEHPAVPKPVPSWWFDPKKTGGGALLDIGSHLIDLFLFFVGDPKLISSHLSYSYNLPVEDGAILTVESEDSMTRGIIHSGWYQKSVLPDFNFRMILHGNYGFLSSRSYEARNIYLHAVKEGTKNLLRKIGGKKIRPLSYSQTFVSYYKELSCFFEAIENDNGSPRGCSAREEMKTIEIIEEAYKQSNMNKEGNSN